MLCFATSLSHLGVIATDILCAHSGDRNVTVTVRDLLHGTSVQRGTVRVQAVNDRPILRSCGACLQTLDNYLPIDQNLMPFTPAQLNISVRSSVASRFTINAGGLPANNGYKCAFSFL